MANRDLTRTERRYRREEFSQVGVGGVEWRRSSHFKSYVFTAGANSQKRFIFFFGWESRQIEVEGWYINFWGFFQTFFGCFFSGEIKIVIHNPPLGVSHLYIWIDSSSRFFFLCVCPLRTYNFYPDGTITLVFFAPMCNIQEFKFHVHVSVTSGHARSITSEPQLLRLFLFSFSFLVWHVGRR